VGKGATRRAHAFFIQSRWASLRSAHPAQSRHHRT